MDIENKIEVDGSHGWHNYNGEGWNSKMALLDELKVRYCEQHGINFLWLCRQTATLEYIRDRVATFTARNFETLIPF
jgi:hypothetical protein